MHYALCFVNKWIGQFWDKKKWHMENTTYSPYREDWPIMARDIVRQRDKMHEILKNVPWVPNVKTWSHQKFFSELSGWTMSTMY
jgi:hypothetical protein